eukprot:TRINITY_DN16938_c0_g2_i1.p1 TRINITY_DN16938_c0_g2~~TRINITY_DN16938_c0_g2_i1.p1  ORF type:complete len:233 (-),score=36.64 TRINITY_DN16938_c0_g2_i1:158-856(-)
MIQNITCRATSEEVLGKINALGFDGTYDFFYIHQRFGSRRSSSPCTHYGYAFINFKASHISQLFMHTLQNTGVALRGSSKTLTVCRAHVQGVEEVKLLFKRSAIKYPASLPWFENGSPGLRMSDNEAMAIKTPSLLSQPPQSDDYETNHINDVKQDAEAVLRLHPAKATMKETKFDIEGKMACGTSRGSHSSLWTAATQRVLPDGEPMNVAIDLAFYEEDPYWACLVYQLHL